MACPNCGYDLYGIPEVRCPECGFRYDIPALRSMAASAEWTRLVAGRTLTVRAVWAAVLVVPAVLDGLGINGIAAFLVVAVSCVIAFVVWVVLTDAYTGLASIPKLLAVMLGLGALFVFVCIAGVLPLISFGAGIIFLILAWMVRIRHWPQLPPAANAPSPKLRRLVIRHSYAGTVLLLLASILVIVALFR